MIRNYKEYNSYENRSNINKDMHEFELENQHYKPTQ